MKNAWALVLLVTLASAGTACGGGAAADATPLGGATAAIDGRSFAVSDVTLMVQSGDDGYFRIVGGDAGASGKDCLPGLGGGLSLYGELPASVSSAQDLSGRELPFEFSGDGDDFNLCFVGSNGLLGVEKGSVKFGTVNGKSVAFTFAGTFVRYDGKGGETAPDVRASGSGTATIE